MKINVTIDCEDIWCSDDETLNEMLKSTIQHRWTARWWI